MSRGRHRLGRRKGRRVLILVLVEYGLWVEALRPVVALATAVLILVLVEYGLWA